MGGVDGTKTIRLDTLLEKETGSRIVVKLDLEGAEYQTLHEATDWLKQEKSVALLCAVYHRHDDANRLSKLFRDWGYQTEMSDGYMLFLHDKLETPYFRHGILRAWGEDFVRQASII